ncbi:MAG: DNA polymerase/3'-5' exonuclease PolX [Chloroflexi bacterium]|nr:DNA polymerase/3'-5' exonuclease PolX [Chloroflexota bacterium]
MAAERVQVTNADIADMLNEMANLLEIDGANPFRVRAYRQAALTIATMPRPLADMVEQGENLTDLPGIGESIAAKIEEIVRTGKLDQLEEERSHIPPQLTELLRVPSLGPKRASVLYKELGITSLEQLKQAAQEQRIRQVKGFGPKLEQTILKDIEQAQQYQRRYLWAEAAQIARPLVEYLRANDRVKRVDVAGSYRRGLETVGDLDILAIGTTDTPDPAIGEYFVRYPSVKEVISRGDTRSTAVLASGMQVDLRVMPAESYGAAMIYFTGSKTHNIHLRQIALDKGLKLSEYGLFRGEERVAGATEQEVYRTLGLDYITPELREDRGEIEAAAQGQLPHLVTLEDIRGDLQAHSKASDGVNTIEEIALAARALGYAYVTITDHSRRLRVARGLDPRQVREQMNEIDRLNARLENITILKGAEVDILKDGSLDLPDDLLGDLDIVVCSVHSSFNLSKEQQTERIIRAMDNPHFNILAHPTGRRLGERQPYEVDMERLMLAALERGCYMEINSQPDRLDLNDKHAHMAKTLGLKLAISSDAHRADDLSVLQYGVMQARRGWLEPEDVLNTRDWPELQRLLRR